MSNDKITKVQQFHTPLERAFQQEEERLKERQAELDKQYGEDTPGSDRKLDAIHQHNYAGDEAAKKKNFDQKIYMLPESFNALRRELHENWRTLFYAVNPETGTSLGHDMAFNAPQFIGILNGVLNLQVQLDSDNVEEICNTFLNALRKKRGVSAIN